MARRYTYSRTIRTIEGEEKFEAHEWDSFDEAQNAVELGIKYRQIQLKERYPGVPSSLIPPLMPGAGGGGGSLIGSTLAGPGATKGSDTTSAPARVVQPGESAADAPKGPTVPSGNDTTGNQGSPKQ